MSYDRNEISSGVKTGTDLDDFEYMWIIAYDV